MTSLTDHPHGTTGTQPTAPTHSSGTASDGTVTWVYLSAQTALVSAPSV